MPQNQVIALVLLSLAVIDPAIGLLVILPRQSDPKVKAILTYAFVASGLIMAGLGYAFWTGLLPGKA